MEAKVGKTRKKRFNAYRNNPNPTPIAQVTASDLEKVENPGARLDVLLYGLMKKFVGAQVGQIGLPVDPVIETVKDSLAGLASSTATKVRQFVDPNIAGVGLMLAVNLYEAKKKEALLAMETSKAQGQTNQPNNSQGATYEQPVFNERVTRHSGW